MNREQFIDDRLVQIVEALGKAHELADELVIEDVRSHFLYRPHLTQALRDLLFAAETLVMAISDVELNGQKAFST